MTIKINGTNTTAQPSITGPDTDTGLVYGDNDVKIVTGGTDRVKVDSGGRVLLEEAVRFQYNTDSTDSRTWMMSPDVHGHGNFSVRVSDAQTSTNFDTKFTFKGTGGLCFNGDTSDANALDDYEEGTWTPTTTNFTHTVDTSECRYTKIGRMVYLTGQLSRDQAAAPTSAILVITGLPFLQSTVTRSVSGNHWMDNGGPSVNDIVGGVTYNNNTTDIIFAISTNPAQKATTRYIQGNNFNQSRGILFSLVYITD